MREAFSVNGTKSEARRRLGLEQDSQYILLAGGSMGAGSIVDAVKAVEGIIQMRPECRLLVLCGTNRRLFSTLEKMCIRDRYLVYQRRLLLSIKCTCCLICNRDWLPITSLDKEASPGYHVFVRTRRERYI